MSEQRVCLFKGTKLTALPLERAKQCNRADTEVRHMCPATDPGLGATVMTVDTADSTPPANHRSAGVLRLQACRRAASVKKEEKRAKRAAAAEAANLEHDVRIEQKAVQMSELKQQLKQEMHRAPEEQSVHCLDVSPVTRPLSPPRAKRAIPLYLNPSNQTTGGDSFDDADGEKGSVMQAKASAPGGSMIQTATRKFTMQQNRIARYCRKMKYSSRKCMQNWRKSPELTPSNQQKLEDLSLTIEDIEDLDLSADPPAATLSPPPRQYDFCPIRGEYARELLPTKERQESKNAAANRGPPCPRSSRRQIAQKLMTLVI